MGVSVAVGDWSFKKLTYSFGGAPLSDRDMTAGRLCWSQRFAAYAHWH
jgi:hypothetical protein